MINFVSITQSGEKQVGSNCFASLSAAISSKVLKLTLAVQFESFTYLCQAHKGLFSSLVAMAAIDGVLVHFLSCHFLIFKYTSLAHHRLAKVTTLESAKGEKSERVNKALVSIYFHTLLLLSLTQL